MMDIYFRDYEDVSSDEAPIHARRASTPQNEAAALFHQSAANLGNRASAECIAASEMIEREMRPVDTDSPVHDGTAITGGKLTWKLTRLELLSLDALYTPMDLFWHSESVRTVLGALQCFSFVRECMDDGDDNPVS
jgi:hypothetical protein